MKYFSNTYKEMRITFTNSFYKVFKHFAKTMTKSRTKFYFTELRRSLLNVNKDFGGYVECVFLKILKMKVLCKKYNIDVDIFRFIDEENDKFVKTVPKGMRYDI